MNKFSLFCIAILTCFGIQGCFQNSRNSNNNAGVQTENIKVRETCEDCNGTGYVYYKCSYCDGSGTYQTYKAHTTKKSCSSCYGTGKMTCTRCNGRGYTTCNGCSGHGYRDCNVCKGIGRVYIMGEYISCPTCNGRLRLECSWCDGSGRLNCSCDNGKTYCSSCYGSGKSNELQTHSESKWVTCEECNGAGAKRGICPTCDGEGETIVTKTIEKRLVF